MATKANGKQSKPNPQAVAVLAGKVASRATELQRLIAGSLHEQKFAFLESALANAQGNEREKIAANLAREYNLLSDLEHGLQRAHDAIRPRWTIKTVEKRVFVTLCRRAPESAEI